MSENEKIDIEALKKELAELKQKMENAKICPHCHKEMEIGDMSWKKLKLGCYKNKECPYKKNPDNKIGLSYTVDMGWESSRIAEINKILQVYTIGYHDGKADNIDLVVFWHWKVSHGGLSSNAMCDYVAGYTEAPADCPLDESDWRRCERAIMKMPIYWLPKLVTILKFDGWKGWEKKLMDAIKVRRGKK